jgi:hypothetical protein
MGVRESLGATLISKPGGQAHQNSKLVDGKEIFKL